MSDEEAVSDEEAHSPKFLGAGRGLIFKACICISELYQVRPVYVRELGL